MESIEKRVGYNPKFKGVLLDIPFLASVEGLGQNKKGQLFNWIIKYVLYGEKPTEEEMKDSSILRSAYNQFMIYNEPRIEKFKGMGGIASKDDSEKAFKAVKKRMYSTKGKYGI